MLLSATTFRLRTSRWARTGALISPLCAKLQPLKQRNTAFWFYLVNPNNPTSTIADSNEIFNWIKSQPKNTFFILDEAYAEFVNDPSFKSCNELVRQGL